MDTNVLIGYVGSLLQEKSYALVSEIIDNQFTISIINKIEVLGYNPAGKDIEDFIELADVLQLSEEIANKTIELRKQYKVKLPDAIIAATALVNNLIIVTRNIKDFDKIEELELFNPYDI